jgi:hypothetical protein
MSIDSVSAVQLIKTNTNFLSMLKFTLSEMEELLQIYSLKFLSDRNPETEWKIKFPTFAPQFYETTFRHNIVPTQEKFWKSWSRRYKNNEILTSLSEAQSKGLQARVYRTYPSLVRDLHFALLLRDSHKFDEVIYNIKLDVQYGIDLIVLHKQKIFAVNLFTDTKRAANARKYKANRHPDITDIINIDLPVSFKGSKKIGDFFLYSHRELIELENEILFWC